MSPSLAGRAAPGPASRYQRIYAVVRRIPPGRVATYGQVARLAGLPGQARQVGYALHALTEGSVVPWHRVINHAGRISLPPVGEGLEQRLRLMAEGVRVDQAGGIALSVFQWRPRSSPPRPSRS